MISNKNISIKRMRIKLKKKEGWNWKGIPIILDVLRFYLVLGPTTLWFFLMFFSIKLIVLVILDWFDVLISKINFKNKKKFKYIFKQIIFLKNNFHHISKHTINTVAQSPNWSTCKFYQTAIQVSNQANKCQYPMRKIRRVLGSVVVVTFQIIFCAEMHANDFFLKKLFLTSAHQNDSKCTNHIKF